MKHTFMLLAIVVLLVLIAIALYSCTREEPVVPEPEETVSPGPEPIEYNNEDTTLPDTGNPLGL